MTQLLPKKDIKPIQATIEMFLYNARAINYPMLLALNEISSTQAKPTEYTKEECQQLMDYAAIYPNVYV